MATTWQTDKATPKALNYVEVLFTLLQGIPEKEETYQIARTWWTDQNSMGHPDGATADQMIKALKRHVYGEGARPQVVTPPQPKRLDLSTIPDGNYAIKENGVTRFYRVSTTKSGFRKVQRRSSDSLLPTRGNQGIAILHQIVEFGLEKAQQLFAKELGRCWCCGKTLTDPVSISFGVGPDCREARGIS